MERQGLPVFDDLCDQLWASGAINSPSELHGLVCGKLCGGERVPLSAWQGAAWEFLDLAEPPGELLADMVASLYTLTLRQLNSEDFDLELLLPEDHLDISQRLQALSQWCHGFLSGIGSAGIAGDSELSADSAEALRDLAAIVQVAVDEESNEQEMEGDFMEVAEYVKIAVLNLYMEFGIKDNDERATQVH